MISSLTRRACIGAAAALAVGTAALPAAAQPAFPSKPIRILVGFSAGGGADGAARAIADALQRKYGVAVTVENRPGAGGRLSSDALAKAEPDGYTLAALVGGDAVTAATDARLPYRFPDDFAPLSTISVYPFVVMTSGTGPYKTLDEFLAAARAGGRSYASPGPGTTQHLAAELLAGMAKAELLHTPYKGTAASVPDLISGRVDISVGTTSEGALIRNGRLRALAVTSRERSPSMPNVPTVAESLPGYEVTTWMGLVAPSRTPASIVQKLSNDIQALVATPEVRSRIEALGLEPQASTAAQMRERMAGDVAKWKAVVRDRHIQLIP
ncbi:tripartite tricarboxylate transporter substrate-binding protein [Paracidovorax cattleyae]|uniref:Tripartite-type tricarboxylate transporter, receptor component TctC n=1 Tax=Paracidovorax cattleyae TaxID=80868 RepID=A0A1H0WAM3_9BURK|nr:tripartite tricarboxylate transporter substrate-binding protein [Paracidovorax cattleyae]SDP87819.1 Tripartite-type tricarboxylate transporter, receptor component TctC [Paracidovorax cattleyae]